MTEKQKVRLNTEMPKNESEDTHPLSSSDNFSSLSSSGLLRKTESVRGTVLSRKAMNLGTIESVSSDDDCGLGGIGESRGNKAICVTGFPCRSTGMTQRDESGKSMVEMLGVLALMGLLAILGAKGYNMAMERAMANEIINDVNKRSLLHSQQLLAGSALDVSEMPDKIRDIYPVSTEKLGVQFFTVKVSQVETPVCRRIADLGYTVPIQVTANGTKITPDNTTPCENQTGIVEMAFTFNRTLTPCPGCLDDIRQCSGSGSCPDGYSCELGICMCKIPCANRCCTSPLQNVCANNLCVECVSDSDCMNNPHFGYDYVCQMNMCAPVETQEGCDACDPGIEFCKYTTVIDKCSRSGVADPICAKKGSLTPVTAHNGEVYYLSSLSVNWWNAKNLCAAFGKHLASWSEACGEDIYRCSNFAGLVGSCSLTWLNAEADSCSSYGLAGDGSNAPWIALQGWTQGRAQPGRALCR